MYTITNAPKAARCPLCTGKADQPQPVFNVRGTGFVGMVCGTHLHVLCNQTPTDEEREEQTEQALFRA